MIVTAARENPGAVSSAEVGDLVRLWGCALSVALLGTWTCFAAPAGINWTLWTSAAAAGLVISRRPAQLGAAARTALALGCALSAAAAITSDPHVDALIFLSVAGLCGFALHSILTPTQPIGPAALIRMPLTLGRAVLSEATARLTQTLAALRIRESARVLRGATLAGALGVMLLLLLSTADPVLADWREGAWSFLHTLHFLTHVAFFTFLALVLLAAYGLAARRSSLDGTGTTTAAAPAPHGALSDIERVMVLGAALASFVLFFAIELSTRLGVLSAGRLPPGETLAQATHRGFGEMILAAGLCATTLILLDRHALRGGRERHVLRLCAAVIIASLVLVLSAYSRVRYYEAIYGYTQLRVDVQIWCAAIFTALLLLAWRLRAAAADASRLDLARLTHHSALTGIACVALLACWNSAGWIVNANLARYARTGNLDVGYLADLALSSPDAVPALVAHLPDLPRADAQRLRYALAHSPLANGTLRAADGGLAWYEWSVRRQAAVDALRAAKRLQPTADPISPTPAASTPARSSRRGSRSRASDTT